MLASGLQIGRSPIYIPTGANASLSVAVSGLAPGLVRVYSGGQLAVKLNDTGSEILQIGNITMRQTQVSYIVAVSGKNDTLAVISNPVIFVQAPMIPNGALSIDNGAWSVEAVQWISNQNQQRLQVNVTGPPGTDATMYLYSPDYKPGASSESEVAREIQVGNVTIDPASVYDTPNSTFVLHLTSRGELVNIIFNFDVPHSYFIIQVLESTSGLFALVALPFAIAYLIDGSRRLRHRATVNAALNSASSSTQL
jgi:hypothetical protein